MRDKLLKSTNEVRASLSKKRQSRARKIANSKDSKLSRDAQMMKTLENAKSDPTHRVLPPLKYYKRLSCNYIKNTKGKSALLTQTLIK